MEARFGSAFVKPDPLLRQDRGRDALPDELGLAVEQGRQLATEAGARLSTTAAEAFTMQCTHAVPR